MEMKKILSAFLALIMFCNFSYAFAMENAPDEVAVLPAIRAENHQEIWGKLNNLYTSPRGSHAGITLDELDLLCREVSPILERQPTLLRISAPISIFGDIHGDFHTLYRFLPLCRKSEDGEPQILFLGDYVDRGINSIETMALLMLLKIEYPDTVFLLRGNHECEQINGNSDIEHNLLLECREVFEEQGETVWQGLNHIFDLFPLAAILNQAIFCVHGGISPLLSSLDMISDIGRPLRAGEMPAFILDLLWSDPSEAVSGLARNEARGISFLFGRDILQRFLTYFRLSTLIRAHQLCRSGFNFPFEANTTCVTLFSATNYSGHQNEGAIMDVDDNLVCRFIQLMPISEQ